MSPTLLYKKKRKTSYITVSLYYRAVLVIKFCDLHVNRQIQVMCKYCKFFVYFRNLKHKLHKKHGTRDNSPVYCTKQCQELPFVDHQ